MVIWILERLHKIIYTKIQNVINSVQLQFWKYSTEEKQHD